jgi:DNA-binding beta-propeller fold protein YncE
LTVGSDAVWLGDGPFRIDARHDTIGKALSGQLATDLSADGRSLWVSDYDQDVVRRYDTSTGKLVATVRLPSGESPEGIAIVGTAVWVAAHHGGTLDRVDPATNKLVKRVSVTSPGDRGAQFVTSGFGSVWVGVGNNDFVVRVDPRSDKVLARVSFVNQMEPCGGLAATIHAIWVSECLDGRHVGRIDPRTNTVTKVLDTGGKVIWMAADRDTVWFVTGGDPDYSPDDPGYLVQISDDGTYLRRYELGNGFTSGSVVIAFGSLWVSSSHKPVVLRIPLPAH